jgi:hypothetical protein
MRAELAASLAAPRNDKGFAGIMTSKAKQPRDNLLEWAPI